MRNIISSRSLQKHLVSIKNAKISIIVAPTGYGKSILIQQLQAACPNAAFQIHQVYSSDLINEWNSLCDSIELIAPQSAQALRDCVQDHALDTNKAVKLLDEFDSCNDKEIFMVIDDFFRLFELMPAKIISSIFRPKSTKLHIILVGHPFQMPYGVDYDPYAIYWVGARDLTFSADDIKNHFNHHGKPVDETIVDRIYQVTGGWPAAVRACVDQAILAQSFDEVAITRRLLSQVSLDRMPPKLLQMLMAMAYLNENGKGVLSFFTDQANMQKTIQMLRNTPLLYLDQASQGWIMHPTLRAFLLLRLQNGLEEERREIFSRLSKYLVAYGRLPDALGCLFQIKDYEGILSHDLKLLQFEDCMGTPSHVIARNLLEACPLEIKFRHRFSMLRLAFLLYSAGDFAAYHIALNQVKAMINPELEPHLYGEWLIVSMLQHLPDIQKMHEVILEAKKHLTHPSIAIAWEEPVFFGVPSMWYLLYNEPGMGDRIGDHLEAFLRDYEKLTVGRGSGSDLLYRGELASLRCQFSLSTAYANSAAVLGESARQPTVVFGVAMLKARNALATSDNVALQEAMKYLDDSIHLFPALQGTAVLREVVRTTRNMIYSMMREVGVFDEKNILSIKAEYNESILLRMTMHIQVLEFLMEGRLDKAIGAMEAVVHQKSSLFSTVTSFVVNAALSTYYHNIGDLNKALDKMKESLSIAAEDEMQAMYVLHLEIFNVLFEHKAMNAFSPFITKIRDTARALNRGLPTATSKSSPSLLSSLTDRERDVAILASQGFRNNEIAQRLFVTESTIKKHMQSIFEKLKIDRRTKLVSLMKNLKP